MLIVPKLLKPNCTAELWTRVLLVAGISNLNFALKIKNASAFQHAAIANKSTRDLSATPGRLEGARRGLAQALGLICGQHAVRSAGHRIFRDALGGPEGAADEVVR